MQPKAICTIGYARVEVVLDIRAVAASRKKGFRRTSLRPTLPMPALPTVISAGSAR
jgi:hypothetical protein